MNKIIRNVRVDELPEDWQEGLPKHGRVEIEIRSPAESVKPRVKLADLAGSAPNVHGSADDVLRYLREGRDDR